MDNVLFFPTRSANLNRKMERILETAQDIEERSKTLLHFTHTYQTPLKDNDNEE